MQILCHTPLRGGGKRFTVKPLPQDAAGRQRSRAGPVDRCARPLHGGATPSADR
jgi:hypothetical protein